MKQEEEEAKKVLLSFGYSIVEPDLKAMVEKIRELEDYNLYLENKLIELTKKASSECEQEDSNRPVHGQLMNFSKYLQH
jgi:hypothetical protein